MKTKPGRVLVRGKDSYRQFTEFRQITRGRNRGMVEITLHPAPARTILVNPWDVRSYPITINNPKGEELEPGLFEVKEE